MWPLSYIKLYLPYVPETRDDINYLFSFSFQGIEGSTVALELELKLIKALFRHLIKAPTSIAR